MQLFRGSNVGHFYVNIVLNTGCPGKFWIGYQITSSKLVIKLSKTGKIIGIRAVNYPDNSHSRDREILKI